MIVELITHANVGNHQFKRLENRLTLVNLKYLVNATKVENSIYTKLTMVNGPDIYAVATVEEILEVIKNADSKQNV